MQENVKFLKRLCLYYYTLPVNSTFYPIPYSNEYMNVITTLFNLEPHGMIIYNIEVDAIGYIAKP